MVQVTASNAAADRGAPTAVKSSHSAFPILLQHTVRADLVMCRNSDGGNVTISECCRCCHMLIAIAGPGYHGGATGTELCDLHSVTMVLARIPAGFRLRPG